MWLTKINLYFQEVFLLCCKFYKDEALSGHELFETDVWSPKSVVFDRRLLRSNKYFAFDVVENDDLWIHIVYWEHVSHFLSLSN